ncbi:hypothetical protein MXB_4594 [Myxobolus squamalis]|nr:hypothetical protein MXB_4594 [Myxobolus squamalis]
MEASGRSRNPDPGSDHRYRFSDLLYQGAQPSSCGQGRRFFGPTLQKHGSIGFHQKPRTSANTARRYNWRIGNAFMNAHPNIASFFTIIRAEFEYYASRCHIIRSTGEVVKYIETKFKKTPIDQDYLNLRGLQN